MSVDLFKTMYVIV